jgi:hypothetical protein
MSRIDMAHYLILTFPAYVILSVLAVAYQSIGTKRRKD